MASLLLLVCTDPTQLPPHADVRPPATCLSIRLAAVTRIGRLPCIHANCRQHAPRLVQRTRLSKRGKPFAAYPRPVSLSRDGRSGPWRCTVCAPLAALRGGGVAALLALPTACFASSGDVAGTALAAVCADVGATLLKSYLP